MRLLWVAVPDGLALGTSAHGHGRHHHRYGNLCALPQRNLKRLLGYSSIAHAGYLMMGIAAMSLNGSSAILYYLGGYLFTVIAAFMVIILVMQHTGAEDIIQLAQLHQSSGAGRRAQSGHGVSGGHSTPGWVLREIPPLQSCSGTGQRAQRLLPSGSDRHHRCGNLVGLLPGHHTMHPLLGETAAGV